jgi:type IV secretion system protein VirD4
MRKYISCYDQPILSRSQSRLADEEEIKRAPTITHINIEQGNYIVGGHPIISNGYTAEVDSSDSHTAILAATGNKKTRNQAMPLVNMLVMAGENFIVSDPKQEIFDRTSGLAAATGYKVYTLDFRDFSKSHMWNPFTKMHRLYHNGEIDESIALANNFISVLAEPQRKNTKDIYFIESTCSLILPLLLAFLETATLAEANISNFAYFCAEKSSPEAAEDLASLMAEGSIGCINIKGVLRNKEARTTWGNVSAGIATMLNPFIIRKSLSQVLSKSSFDIRTASKEKSAIYIILPDEHSTFNVIGSLFIKYAYEELILEAQRHSDKRLPIRMNFVLEEVCNFTTISDFCSMLSASRSRNIRFSLFIQSLWQLKQKYGEDANTILGNCQTIIFMSSRELDLLNLISNLCGEIALQSNDGTIYKHPLLSISELQRLNKESGETLILVGRNYPLITELPDIDEYKFKKYPPIKRKSRSLPELVRYDPDKVIEEIRNKQRPILFSREVYGHDTYISKSTGESSIFDW